MPDKKKDDDASNETREPREAPLPVLIVVVIAMACFVLFRSGFDPANIPKWVDGLTSPHVVPAPAAGKNEVVVQFCQS